jgi:hypothetical protein
MSARLLARGWGGALAALAILTAGLPAAALAQPERLANGPVTVQPLTGSLERTLDRIRTGAAEPQWAAYEVATPPGDRWLCDWNEWSRRQAPATTARLEPATIAYVFYRLEAGRIDRVRIFSPGCAIDAGGRRVTWLTGVSQAESVRSLAALARSAEKKLMDGALAALSVHAGAEALEATIALARTGTTAQTRGQALFWLAQRAGVQAIGAIDDALARDPDTDVKKRAVFALSQLPADEGVPRLIDVARSHSNPAVRKQAMFWLGQSGDPRALAFFESVLLK